MRTVTGAPETSANPALTWNRAFFESPFADARPPGPSARLAASAGTSCPTAPPAAGVYARLDASRPGAPAPASVSAPIESE